MLWAALTADGQADKVSIKQVQVPLRWLQAFARQHMAPVERRCRWQPPYYTIITFDGSLTGGGATFQTGLRDVQGALTAPITAYWMETWTPADADLLHVKLGDSAGQARWEAFTLLQCIASWIKPLTVAQGRLVVTGDAMGVLQDAVKFRARDPLLNLIMGELALLIAPLGHELEAAHVWSERNVTCDALSRMTVDTALPERLMGVPRTRRASWDYSLLQE